MRDTDPLLVLLDTSYNQASWHGVNLRGSLRRVPLEIAAWRPAPGAHNVWELMVHALRLTGVADHDVYHAGQIQLLKKLYSLRRTGR